MLGRHVYRVHPLEIGGWEIGKDGEAARRDRVGSRDAAVKLASALAAADPPSRLIVEDDHGGIAEEKLFGADDADIADGSAPPRR